MLLYKLVGWTHFFCFSAVLRINCYKTLGSAGDRKFLSFTLQGKMLWWRFKKRLFLFHFTFLRGGQAAKKKDDSPSLLVRLKIRFLLSILLKTWCCELLTSTTPKYGLSNYFKTGKSGSKKVETTFPSQDSSRAQSNSLGTSLLQY